MAETIKVNLTFLFIPLIINIPKYKIPKLIIGALSPTKAENKICHKTIAVSGLPIYKMYSLILLKILDSEFNEYILRIRAIVIKILKKFWK